MYSKQPPRTPIEPHDPLCSECSSFGTRLATAVSIFDMLLRRQGKARQAFAQARQGKASFCAEKNEGENRVEFLLVSVAFKFWSCDDGRQQDP